ncbi:DUF4238 domain-containing protein [Pontimicrobium sp. IMCC45349]|uniref:DUF4238 domain-containing protein n=1 Tax=Pontimicrobium sp. IMCC45349 TaxID=3391574 RepID=UPI0039A39FF6
MNTERKNQHYIPKFYLRNFSYKKNLKQIGIFNLKRDFFYQTSKLKTQGSKKFFYGYDGIIEERLGEIENLLSKTIKKIIEELIIPKKNSNPHIDLLLFVALTDLRNPTRIDNMKGMISGMKDKILELYPNTQIEKLIPTLTHDDFIEFSITTIPEITFNIIDLDFKLLINETERPFISSDNPVVRYNQFLEQKRWPHGKCGYGIIGLQIFIPLNSKIVLHFYDSSIYKVGFKRQKTHSIKNLKCIDQINTLQFINCIETIYFDENANENYIRNLKSLSLNFKKANKPQVDLSYLVDKDNNDKEIINLDQKNLIISGTTDCETNLKIEGIKIHSRGKAYKMTNKVTQLRKHSNHLINTTRNNSY